MERLRNREGVDRPCEPIGGAVLHEEAAIEQHPDRLDRVERDALGASEDAVAHLRRHAGDKAGEQCLHRRGRERVEVDRREAALPRTPARTAGHEFRAGECDHEDRRVARPVEQVLDEIEQTRVGPLEILEREHDRIGVGEALEQQAPGREQVALVADIVIGEAEQLGDAGLDECALLRIRHMLVQGAAELHERIGHGLVLGDSAAHPHHVGERPVGDALAVGQAATAMPVHGRGEPVEVLVELPGEARLADPRDARHRHEVGAALVRRPMEEVLDLAQLAIAPDERRLQALGLERAAQAGDDTPRPPERRQPILALERVGAGVLEHDRPLRGAPRRLTDEHLPGLGGGLHPRGRVHEVAGDHPLAGRADRHRRLAGQDPGAGAESLHAELVAERGHGGDEVESGSHCPLGVVLRRRRRTPDRHHRIADEFLDGAAVELDQAPARVEVAREELAGVLGVAPGGGCREADEVGEQHADEPALGDGRGRPRCPCRRGRRDGSAALAAEPVTGLERRTAGGAPARERSAAGRTELATVAIADTAVRAGDHRVRDYGTLLCFVIPPAFRPWPGRNGQCT